LHVVQLMPLPPHHLLFPENPDWFNLSGAGLPRLSVENATVKRGLYVCLPDRQRTGDTFESDNKVHSRKKLELKMFYQNIHHMQAAKISPPSRQ